MKSLGALFAVSVCLLVALPASAVCTFNLRYESGVLRWDPIPAATGYRILEIIDGAGTRNHFTDKTSISLPHRASVAVGVTFDVTAELKSGIRGGLADSNDSCTATLETTIAADAAFRKLTRKAILPIVASSAGANGAKFRTSMTMRGLAGQRGKIVFHRAGQVASDDDPSIRYSFEVPVKPLVFDDIVAAIGQSGTGTLDIIPDDDADARIPEVEVYLFNETAGGTFGTFAQPAYPFDYLRPASLPVRVPDVRFRANIGLRTLTDTKIRVAVFGADERLRHFQEASFPAGWMQMTSAAELAGVPLQPGESVALLFVDGAAITFYTITENATNDPTLVVAPARRSTTNVGAYVD